MDGPAIKEVRSRLALGQAELATLLGVHWVTVSKWERGVLAPDPYRDALLVRFQEAASRKAFGDTVVRELLGRGVAAALFLLLKAAFEHGTEEPAANRGNARSKGRFPAGRAARSRGGKS